MRDDEFNWYGRTLLIVVVVPLAWSIAWAINLICRRVECLATVQ